MGLVRSNTVSDAVDAVAVQGSAEGAGAGEEVSEITAEGAEGT